MRMIGIGGLIALILTGSAQGEGCSTPTFGVPSRVYSPATGLSTPGDFLTADLMGDGRADLVLVDTSDDAIVLLPRTDAGFGPPHDFHPGALRLRAADFDGGGRLDLLAVRQTEMQVIFVDAVGALRPGPVTSLPYSPLLPLAATGDFDEDGRTDVVVLRSIGIPSDVLMLRGDGHGGFLAPIPLPLPSGTGGVFSVLAGDFDGDGHLDLIFLSNYYRELGALLLGDGKGGFTASLKNFDMYAWEGIVADVDGDGIDDLLLGGMASNAFTFAVLYGGRSSPLSVHSWLNPAWSTYGLMFASFQDDGTKQIGIFAGKYSSSASVHFIQSSGRELSAAGSVSVPGSPFPEVENLTSTGGSARSDIVLQRTTGAFDLLPNTCGSTRPDMILPAVVSIDGVGGTHFESQLTLSNLGSGPLAIDFAYRPFRGSGSGSGTFSLPPGQKTFPVAVDFLRSIGIAIPPGEGTAGSVAMRVTSGAITDLSALVRTTSSTPGITGNGGVASLGVAVSQAISGKSWIPWLREDEHDRTNAAFIHAGSVSDGDLTLRLSVIAMEPAAPGIAGSRDVVLHPGEPFQIDRVLRDLAPGTARGILHVERTAGVAPYLAYAVLNDNGTGDGSWVPAIADSELAIARGSLVIPAIVETGRFSSEVVITNLSPLPRTLDAKFKSELLTTPDLTARFTLTVPASGQVDLQDFIQHLRGEGVAGIPPRGPDIAAALFLTPSDGDSTTLLAGSRASTSTPAGRYGTYIPAIPQSASSTQAVILGLRQDAESRTNLALVNTSDSKINVRFWLHDDAGSVSPMIELYVDAGRWLQVDQVLKNFAPGASGAYASIISSRPFLSYAVINDGSEPGLGTGDGSYIPMRSF